MTTGTRKVLIVDDEPDIRDSVADILNEFGYDADTAGSGAEALGRLQEDVYDVALLDFRMPEMDGLTLFRKMRNVSPETSAILVSAYTGDGVAEAAIESGIRRVISKPVDMTEVIAEVDRQLERPLALVVDDDSDFCESLRDVLDENGFRVSLAGDEVTAGELLNSREPQVVVLDMVLDVNSDPARLFSRIRDANPSARIVLVTGHQSESIPLINELMDAGAAALCPKPVHIPDLMAAIQTLA
jgi:DNA-binding NtrC family response regulator